MRHKIALKSTKITTNKIACKLFCQLLMTTSADYLLNKRRCKYQPFSNCQYCIFLVLIYKKKMHTYLQDNIQNKMYSMCILYECQLLLYIYKKYASIVTAKQCSQFNPMSKILFVSIATNFIFLLSRGVSFKRPISLC